MVKITGSKEHVRRLDQAASPELVRKVGAALFVGGNMVQVEAQRLITSGAVSGKNHVPSKPGEPPNADTHALDRQIETVQVAPLRTEVSSNAPYAVALEKGTSKMAPRPSMGPAAKAKRKAVVELVGKAVSSILRKK